MNLILDFGNTRVKAALFEGKQLASLHIFDSPEALLSDLSLFSKAGRAFIGSVTTGHEKITEALGHIMPLNIFTAQTPVPLSNRYKSAATLGSDRLAASVGAFGLYPGQDTLVIDAGTCVKYNFTNRHNEYLGGAISPGLQMRFKAMHQFTGRLPLLNPDHGFDRLVGLNSEESLQSGVINGLIYETDGFINDYKKQYPQLRVVLTGGDTGFFVKRLKNSIFADHDLVLKGLNDILIYNS